jgi:uncharacterized protein (TIGR03437 family)
MKTRVHFLLLSAVSAAPLLAQAPTISGVVNGFSYTTQISPGVLATIFGSNLSGNNLEVTLHGVQCPVIYTSATQLNIQLPWQAPTGAGHVTVSHDGLSSTPFSVTLTAYSPALISSDGSGTGVGYFTSGSNAISTTNPANAGDVLTTVAVGLGDSTPASVTGVDTPEPPPLYTTLATPSLTVGGKSTTLLFSGLAPGLLATDQLNFTLAPNTPVGTPTVTLKVGSLSTSLITIPIGCLDVTTSVSVSLGPLKHPSAGKYTQTVTIQNTSGQKINAKGSLILTGLTSSAQLTNGGGTLCPSSDGSPYKSIEFTGTGSAQTATTTLDFTDSSTGTIAYGQRVLSQ